MIRKIFYQCSRESKPREHIRFFSDNQFLHQIRVYRRNLECQEKPYPGFWLFTM